MAVQAIWNNDRIGDPTFLGMTLGGTIEYTSSGTFVKADYPGLRAIRQDNDEPILAVDLPASHPITPATTTGTPGTPPGGTLGYAQRTTDQGFTTSESDIGSVTSTVTVAASRRLRVTLQANIQQITAAGVAQFRIRDGTTQLARWTRSIALNNYDIVHVEAVTLPSTGSHTYKGTAQTSAGGVNLLAQATEPAFIIVEDITLATAAGGGSTGSVLELWY
jgi:hypothetical protein